MSGLKINLLGNILTVIFIFLRVILKYTGIIIICCKLISHSYYLCDVEYLNKYVENSFSFIKTVLETQHLYLYFKNKSAQL